MTQSLAQVYIHLVFHTKYNSVTIRTFGQFNCI